MEDLQAFGIALGVDIFPRTITKHSNKRGYQYLELLWYNIGCLGTNRKMHINPVPAVSGKASLVIQFPSLLMTPVYTFIRRLTFSQCVAQSFWIKQQNNLMPQLKLFAIEPAMTISPALDPRSHIQEV